MAVQRLDSPRTRPVAGHESRHVRQRCTNVSSSTLISGARYWPDDRALELCFTGGRRYLYLGVPRPIADAFTRSSSMGRFFNDEIKGRFTCHELASEAVPRRPRAAND